MVDASVSIRELKEFLDRNNYSMFVMPGTEKATIGGCIAADVHGKNTHLFGSFGDHVLSMHIYNPIENKVYKVLPETDFFRWTVGGFGVTGVILYAELKIARSFGKSLMLRFETPDTPARLVSQLLAAEVEADDLGAWFSNVNGTFMSKLFVANWCNRKPIKKRLLPKWLTVSIFIAMGFRPLRNFWGVMLANYIWMERQPKHPQFSNNVLFPLSGIVGWNRYFGNSFVERQFLVPVQDSTTAIEFICALIRSHSVVTPFCGIKLFRGQRSGVMSFATEGISISVQYASNETELDRAITNFLKSKNYKEYLAKVQELTTSFPCGYLLAKQWLDLSRANSSSSRLIDWLSALTEKGEPSQRRK